MNRVTFRIRYRPKARDGSVALMLVLILALLVGTFATAVASLAMKERQNVYHHAGIAVLQSAIHAVDESDVTSDSSIQLPIDDKTEQWVVVEPITQPEPQWQATLYRQGQPLLSIRRPRSDER